MSPAPETSEHELLPRGRSAAERAYEYVKARLLDGRFAGGTLLSENDLAQRLGVSRTPVRQALVQLEAEELVELYPRRGALVVPISPSEAEDVLEARLLIEQHCARRAAGAGPHVAARLRESLADQDAALDSGDARGFAWADRQFHAIIVEAAGNETLALFEVMLRRIVDGASRSFVEAQPSASVRLKSHRATVKSHTKIVDLIEAGDVAAADDLWSRHLDEVNNRMSARGADGATVLDLLG